jgi:hypothetical protein
MKVVLVGDVYPGGDLEGPGARSAVAVPAYHAADCRIATLESALSDSAVRAKKYVLTCKPSGARLLKDMGLTAVSLAQNHIQDMGDLGIAETIRILDAEGIGHFGAGMTLSEARRPVWITEDLCVLSYCRHRALTLNQIAVAEADKPGVVPLTLENVLEDLCALPSGKKAILVFHWGCEHLWLTPYDNIELSRRLLREEKVALIVGSHPHRVQGYLEQCGKRAYFSLGNFLFPNFFIDKPCVQVASPPRTAKVPVTRYYHRVGQLTYKKWLRANRVSLLVRLDSGKGQAGHQFLMQKDSSPEVVPAPWWIRAVYGARVEGLAFLSSRCPASVYKPLFALHHAVAFGWWRRRIMFTRAGHMGLAAIGSKVAGKLLPRRWKSEIRGSPP